MKIERNISLDIESKIIFFSFNCRKGSNHKNNLENSKAVFLVSQWHHAKTSNPFRESESLWSSFRDKSHGLLLFKAFWYVKAIFFRADLREFQIKIKVNRFSIISDNVQFFSPIQLATAKKALFFSFSSERGIELSVWNKAQFVFENTQFLFIKKRNEGRNLSAYYWQF